MAPHSSTLAWKIPKDRWAWWAAVHGVAKSWTQLSEFTYTFHFHALEKEMATHSSVPAWRIPGTGEPGGPPSMGSHRVGHDWSDLAAAAADPVITLTQCWCCRSRGTAPEPSSGWQGWGLDLQHQHCVRVLTGSAAAAAKSLQSCPTLCDPIDGGPPGSPVPGLLQAGTLEWVAISFSNAWKWKVKVNLLSCVQLLATPWTAAHQAHLSLGIFQARVLEWGAIAFSGYRIYWLPFRISTGSPGDSHEH